MSAPPWMPLYVADYLADTRHLTTIEHGAYLLLIMHYWRHGGLPDDDGRLAQITGMTVNDWLSIRSTIAALFADGWRHARVDLELEASSARSARRSAAGRKGGIVSRAQRSPNDRPTIAQRSPNDRPSIA